MPTISVIMPVYNAARYLNEAVESVLAQTFADFELIVVNDGSTDGSERILHRLAAKDGRIKLISRPNTGYVAAIDEAIAASAGQYLARMDADDVCLPERFAKQVALLDARPNVGVVGTSYDLIDARGRFLHTMRQPTSDDALQRACLAGSTPICHPTAMIRRSTLDAVGGYDASAFPAEDLDLWLRLGEVSQLACLPEPLLRYRLHAASISETRQAKQIEAVRHIRHAAFRRRGLPAELVPEKQWREGVDTAGRIKQTLKYGWWAFNSGERRTAISYGVAAVRQGPKLRDAWTLLGCSLLKRLPTPRVVYAEASAAPPRLAITPALSALSGSTRRIAA